VKTVVFTGKKIKYICMKILSVIRDLVIDLFNNIKGFFCVKQEKVIKTTENKPVKRKYNKKNTSVRKPLRKKGGK